MLTTSRGNPRIVAWGTYDLGKPRTRILLRGLRQLGVDLTECHREIWEGVEDKSQISGGRQYVRFLLRWLLAYPILVVRYFFCGPHDAVFVGYMGHLDVLVLWPWAKLRRKPIVWDAFLSLYSTVVHDRRLFSRRNPLSLLLYASEWLACRAADRVVLDTAAHARLFQQLYKVEPERLAVVLVGAEPEHFFTTAPSPLAELPRQVLFYGQLIPLHGLSTILAAADRSHVEDAEWLIVGDGQERHLLRDKVREPGTRRGNVRWVQWIPYADLRRLIADSAVCLGIFGSTDKASRVIPNKAYQILATGRPLITRDSPAIRELVGDDPERYGVTLVPPGDSEALATAVRRVLAGGSDPREWVSERQALVARFGPEVVAGALLEILREATRWK